MNTENHVNSTQKNLDNQSGPIYPLICGFSRRADRIGGRMPVGKTYHRDSGVTVVEAVIACAVLAAVIVLLLVVLSGNRKQARSYVCEDNLKQLAQANLQYASDHQGKFFPQWMIAVSGERPELSMWCDNKRLGQYTDDVQWERWEFAKHKGQNLKEAVGGIVRCPQAEDDEIRSYGQNHWASGLGLVKLKASRSDLGHYSVCEYGDHFDVGSDKIDQLMLFVESNAELRWGTNWVTQYAGLKGRPSDRFNGGVPVDADYRRHLDRGIMHPQPRYKYYIPWEIDYSRHGSVNNPLAAQGETNISFADGHVARFSHEQLYDPVSLTSTYNALWSTKDRYYDEVREPHEKPDQ
jgi:prepilin-type processing-associated H-X9-DG protein